MYYHAGVPQQQYISPQELYQRQIGSLFATYPNQVRGLQNGNHFEVPVYLATARLSITIVVRLEQGFPDTPPTIQIHPPIAHRWVNHEGKVVGHEHLVNWNKNCALGRIVKDIEIEFNLRPPHPAVSINRTESPRLVAEEKFQFKEVDSLSAAEIQAILGNEERFEQFFEKLGEVQKIHATQKELWNGNLKMAKENLALKGEVDELKGKVLAAMKDFEAVEESIESCLKNNASILKNYSEASVNAKFQQEISKAARESEFLQTSGSGSLGDFAQLYQAQRIDYHRKAVLYEKMKQKLST